MSESGARSDQMPQSHTRHSGKLLILLPGLCGAVASTFVAGVAAMRHDAGRPFGSLTQMQRMPGSDLPVHDALGLAPVADLAFAGWDIDDRSVLDAVYSSGVLEVGHVLKSQAELAEIRPMTAAFDPAYVKRIAGKHIKTGTRREMAEALREDIRTAMANAGADRAVMVWCGSTEKHNRPGPVHATLDAFEQGLDADDPSISPSQLYAYAALLEGVPYANGAPNLSADIGALEALAATRNVPIAGKDFKTGQTLLKTVIAPALRDRMLGVQGWFSTNILGNRDGEVLDEPDNFAAKEATKAGVFDGILDGERYPELYGDVHHKVRIEYYPPRGDNKESWDNIDLVGWLGYPMQLKINFLCRDSILAAPLVLDLALFLDAAGRAGWSGCQDWLGFYFKSPHIAPGGFVEHGLGAQHDALMDAMRALEALNR